MSCDEYLLLHWPCGLKCALWLLGKNLRRLSWFSRLEQSVVRVPECVCVCTWTCVCVQINVHMCVCVCADTCVHVHVCVCMCVCGEGGHKAQVSQYFTLPRK